MGLMGRGHGPLVVGQALAWLLPSFSVAGAPRSLPNTHLFSTGRGLSMSPSTAHTGPCSVPPFKSATHHVFVTPKTITSKLTFSFYTENHNLEKVSSDMTERL